MINKATLVGNVGNEPEVRNLENDVKVATFSLATSERYTDKNGQRQERTEWHRIAVWRSLANVVEQYVHKGSQVYVEGRITYRQYKDKDGNERYTTEIVATELKLLGRNPNSNQTGNYQANEPTPEYAAQRQDAPEPTDDLPF